jgi:hypothetical protein
MAVGTGHAVTASEDITGNCMESELRPTPLRSFITASFFIFDRSFSDEGD